MGSVFFICLPSMRLRAWNLAVIRECLLAWDVETGENICSSDPCRSGWASVLSSRRNTLPRGSSCLGRPRSWPALPRLAAGGPCVSGGKGVTYQPACCRLSLARIPCSMRCCFQLCFPGSRCGFFSISFFVFTPLSVWLRGPFAAAIAAGKKLGSGFVGRPTSELPGFPGSPSSANDMANCYGHYPPLSLKPPPEQGQALSPGAQGSWLLCTVILTNSAFSLVPASPRSVFRPSLPWRHHSSRKPTGMSSSFLPGTNATWCSLLSPPGQVKCLVHGTFNQDFLDTYWVSGSRDVMVNKTDIVTFLKKFLTNGRERDGRSPRIRK